MLKPQVQNIIDTCQRFNLKPPAVEQFSSGWYSLHWESKNDNIINAFTTADHEEALEYLRSRYRAGERHTGDYVTQWPRHPLCRLGR